MRNFFAALLILAPFHAQAQMVVNLPPVAKGSAVMYFDNLEVYASSPTSLAGNLSGFQSASINCDKNNFFIKGAASFDLEPQVGSFSFESLDTCLSIAHGIASHPGMQVKFTVTIDPSRTSAEGVAGGSITSVEWEKLGK